MNVVLAGGGTAGHIEPALNLADELRRTDPDIGITALGTPQGLETVLVPRRGYDLALIPAVPLPRRPTVDLVTLPTRLLTAIQAVRAIFERVDADVVVGFGGYVAMPAYLAARGRVPIVVHEANAKAGLANRIGARFTPWVAESVAGSLPDAQLTGIPLRSQITSLDRVASAPAARAMFGLDPGRATVVVTGGSQGARRINDVTLHALNMLHDRGIQVLHIVGPRNADQMADTDAVARTDGYVSTTYVDGMENAYAAADVIVCRGGAMTCAELAAVGLPAVIVPLAIGNGEQSLNATSLLRAGLAVEIADEDLTPQSLVEAVVTMLDVPLPSRSRQPDNRAAEALADLVRRAAGLQVSS